MKRVAIVDYGLNNLDSVARAVDECGGEPLIAGAPEDLARADCFILPGVGAFADAMEELRNRGLDQALRGEVVEHGIPLLGICLGMQLLAGHGHEGGRTSGLGLIPGEVVRLAPSGSGERIPHVGWNEVAPVRGHFLFEGLPPGKDFYFVHSFHFRPQDEQDVLATTDYCGGFASAVCRGPVLGVQFHPEKSQKAGLQLLRNFIAGCGPC